MSTSGRNCVGGRENGSDSGWSVWSIRWGSGFGSAIASGSRTSSSTGWSGSWRDPYNETVTYPAFQEDTNYGLDYGGGREEYFNYLGDAFWPGDFPGSDSGMFPFAFSDEELLFGQGAVSTPNQAAISIDRRAAAHEFPLVEAGHGKKQFSAVNDKSNPVLTATSTEEQPPRTQPDEVRANGEAQAGGEG